MSKHEINRLLAEKVMGWTEENGCLRVLIENIYVSPCGSPEDYEFDYGGDTFVWNPRDRIAQAMMVVDEVVAMGYAFSLNYFRVGGWRAFFEDGSSAYRSDANAIPTLAICEAALKVVEND